MDVAAWRRCYRQYSEWPLLDVPRLHVALWHVDNRLGGSGAPLPPFERLSRWAAAKLRGCTRLRMRGNRNRAKRRSRGRRH